jgi:hypothetical protein
MQKQKKQKKEEEKRISTTPITHPLQKEKCKSETKVLHTKIKKLLSIKLLNNPAPKVQPYQNE